MAQDSLKSIIAICDGFNLVLPANMVADIVSGVNVVPADNPHNWQKGNLSWQGMTIPVISFEQVICNKHPRLRGSHVAVIRGTSDTKSLPYYGLPTQAMPSEHEINSESEIIEEVIGNNLNQIAIAARVRGVPCVIPEMAQIEEQIAADIRAAR